MFTHFNIFMLTFKFIFIHTCEKCDRICLEHFTFMYMFDFITNFHIICKIHVFLRSGKLREPLRKKYGIFWEFFPNVGPPPPPLFGRPPSKKNIRGLFCVLGPKEHFWFLQKCSLFVSILTYTFGNRGPSPPPLQGKTPK